MNECSVESNVVTKRPLLPGHVLLSRPLHSPLSTTVLHDSHSNTAITIKTTGLTLAWAKGMRKLN